MDHGKAIPQHVSVCLDPGCPSFFGCPTYSWGISQKTQDVQGPGEYGLLAPRVGVERIGSCVPATRLRGSNTKSR